MKNSIEIRQERATAIEKANDLLNLAKNESRDFSADEQTSYDGMMENIDKMAKDIEVVERQEKLNAEVAQSPVSFDVNKNIVPKEARNYSIFKAVEGYINGNMDGIEKEAHEEAVNEARSSGSAILGIGVPSSMLESRAIVDETNSSIAPTTLGAFQDGLRENSVYEQVGATVLNGLSANTEIPVVGANNAAYAGTTENAEASDVGAQFSSLTLSPKRISGFVDLSKQLIVQTGSGAEQSIIRDLGRSVAEAMNAAMFAKDNVTGADVALFNVTGVNDVTTTAYAAGTSVTADLLAMEEELAAAKGLQGNLNYVTNPALMSEMRQASLVSSVSAAMQGMNFNGYNTVYTTGSAKDATNSNVVTIFGDFSKLMVGHFGPGLDITVDNFTQARKAAIRLVINKYCAFGLTHPAAFSRCLVEYAHV
tara:strand:- start:262 stop:1530 length:1269 start_codon:yes stop_codon:yes gene_type:complete